MAADPSPPEALKAAVRANDAAAVADVLQRYPQLSSQLDDPLPDFGFGATLLGAVYQNNREMVDVLLRAGADINARSHWWAGSFGVLDHDGPLILLSEENSRVYLHELQQGRHENIIQIWLGQSSWCLRCGRSLFHELHAEIYIPHQ